MATSRATSRIAATIGVNVKAAREAAGLTQRQLGEFVNGVDAMAISRWERGWHRPSDANLLALAEALGKDVAWFYAEHEAAA